MGRLRFGEARLQCVVRVCGRRMQIRWLDRAELGARSLAVCVRCAGPCAPSRVLCLLAIRRVWKQVRFVVSGSRLNPCAFYRMSRSSRSRYVLSHVMFASLPLRFAAPFSRENHAYRCAIMNPSVRAGTDCPKRIAKTDCRPFLLGFPRAASRTHGGAARAPILQAPARDEPRFHPHPYAHA